MIKSPTTALWAARIPATALKRSRTDGHSSLDPVRVRNPFLSRCFIHRRQSSQSGCIYTVTSGRSSGSGARRAKPIATAINDMAAPHARSILLRRLARSCRERWEVRMRPISAALLLQESVLMRRGILRRCQLLLGQAPPREWSARHLKSPVRFRSHKSHPSACGVTGTRNNFKRCGYLTRQECLNRTQDRPVQLRRSANNPDDSEQLRLGSGERRRATAV